MKKCNSLTIAILFAALSVFVFGSSFAVAGDMAKKVPGSEHRLMFPGGHGEAKTGCYYDEEEDVYICSFEAPVAVDKDTKMMHQGGEPVFKMVPKAKHKAHKTTGIPCYYDEEESVYFCANAE
jgi:hypothetical protein